MAERWRLPEEVITAIARSAAQFPDANTAVRRFKAQLFNARGEVFAAIDSNGGLLGIAINPTEAESRWGSAVAKLVSVKGRAGTGAKPKQRQKLGYRSLDEAQQTTPNLSGPKRESRSFNYHLAVQTSRTFGAGLSRMVRKADEFIVRRDTSLNLAEADAARLVIDTSVVSAGVLDPGSASGRILEMVMAGKILPVAVGPLTRELGVIESAGNKKLLRDYRRHVLPLSSVDTGRVNLPRNLVGDPGDLPVVKSALLGDHPPLPVVTRDQRHLLAARQMLAEQFGIRVFTPDGWLKCMAAAALGLTDDDPES